MPRRGRQPDRWLREHCRQLWEARPRRPMTERQMAIALGVPVESVEAVQARALAKIRAALERREVAA